MPLLKEKTSKMGSVVGFLVVTAFIVGFFLALPEFLLSTTGRLFAALWALVAIGVILAHGRRISLRRQPVRLMTTTANIKRAASQKEKHMMRG